MALWAADLRDLTVDRGEVITAAILCGIGVLHTEVAVGVERLRRRATETSHADLSTVWMFAGAVLLPPAWSTVVTLVVFNHLSLRPWRGHVPLFKHLFSLATVILACHAAAAAVAYVGGGLGLAALGLAILVYITVYSSLVAGAIALDTRTTHRRAEQLWGCWDDNMLELSTLCLGALAAVALMANPWQLALMLVPLLVLHRAVLVRQLEELAATDSKTKLLNSAAWHVQAAREFRRAQRAGGTAAVLMMDLDHFKSVNDMHGHLAGDEVLGKIAEAVRDAVRDHDLVGRFGGEEFVVLLPGLDGEHPRTTELHTIAERIRYRVATLTVAIDTPDGSLTIDGLSTSVGGATYPTDGANLEQVMQAADNALYVAKRNGRNAVCITPLAHSGATRPPPAARDQPTSAAQSAAG